MGLGSLSALSLASFVPLILATCLWSSWPVEDIVPLAELPGSLEGFFVSPKSGFVRENTSRLRCQSGFRQLSSLMPC